MDTNMIEWIADKIVCKLKTCCLVEVEASGRHIHLCREDVEKLFGEGYVLTKVADLSQPGQFVCKERLTVIGPKGKLTNVVVLGPERPFTQVEVSQTDAVALGVKAPLRESGNIKGTPGIIIASEHAQVEITEGVIVAKRHIHMTPEDAQAFCVQDKQVVKMQVCGERKLIFDDVVVRVSPNFRTYAHIDYDEANACGFKKGCYGIVIAD